MKPLVRGVEASGTVHGYFSLVNGMRLRKRLADKVGMVNACSRSIQML